MGNRLRNTNVVGGSVGQCPDLVSQPRFQLQLRDLWYDVGLAKPCHPLFLISEMAFCEGIPGVIVKILTAAKT